MQNSFKVELIFRNTPKEASRIQVNHFIFDEFKVAEMLFLQVLPRYPVFYGLPTKKKTLFFVNFVERILKHTFLFSRFLDPILIDSFFLVSAQKFHFLRPLKLGRSFKREALREMGHKSEEVFAKMVALLDKGHRFIPMNLVLRVEILRVYIRFYFENMEQLLQIMDKLRMTGQPKKENADEAGTLELEQKVFDHLRHLRNLSLSLFMTSKLVSWFDFLDKFEFVDLFIDYFEFLALEMSEQNFFKHELVLKFLSFPLFARRAEVVEEERANPGYQAQQRKNLQRVKAQMEKATSDRKLDHQNETVPIYAKRRPQ